MVMELVLEMELGLMEMVELVAVEVTVKELKLLQVCKLN